MKLYNDNDNNAHVQRGRAGKLTVLPEFSTTYYASGDGGKAHKFYKRGMEQAGTDSKCIWYTVTRIKKFEQRWNQPVRLSRSPIFRMSLHGKLNIIQSLDYLLFCHYVYNYFLDGSMIVLISRTTFQIVSVQLM